MLNKHDQETADPPLIDSGFYTESTAETEIQSRSFEIIMVISRKEAIAMRKPALLRNRNAKSIQCFDVYRAQTDVYRIFRYG
jgi:hypothetical protein